MSTAAKVGSSDMRASQFATTHWSVVLAAGGQSKQSDLALEMLCAAYWFPVYAYVRRRGHQVAEAQDLTQEFFARVIEKEYLRAADQEKGRFRAFLLTMLKRYLADALRDKNRQKRGGNLKTFSIDFDTGESRFAHEPVDSWTPEKLFDRRWAIALLDRTLLQLEQQYAEKGKQNRFDLLKQFLTPSDQAESYSDVAAELGMNEGAIKVAVHRLRQKFRELLRIEVANTVEADREIDSELDYLLAALRGE